MTDAAAKFDLGQLDRRVLLTGAGFSRNWGGYLASEMWGAIFSHPRVQKNEVLRQLLLGEMNFEVALAKVRADTSINSNAVEMDEAIRAAFRLQDANNCHALSERIPSSWTRFSEGILRSLVGKDQHRPDLTSFVFTLNQDVLFERGFAPPIASPPSLPGVQVSTAFWKMPREGAVRMDPYDDYVHGCVVESSVPIFDVRERLNYIKLHGSFNWRTEKGDLMVLGRGKSESISRFPLLTSYGELFRHVLMSGDIRLLVVGYSFGDLHINKAIADAIRQAGLRLVVIDPLGNGLQKVLRGAQLWNGLADLISRPLGEIFASDWGVSLSGEFQRLRRSFLDQA